MTFLADILACFGLLCESCSSSLRGIPTGSCLKEEGEEELGEEGEGGEEEMYNCQAFIWKNWKNWQR